MKINMKKLAILTVGVLATTTIMCNKKVTCDTCDTGYPVSNEFKNKCETPWLPTSDINPCNIYQEKIDSLQLEIMDIGWKLDSMTLEHDYNYLFTN